MNMKIYEMTHKEFAQITKSPIYTPLWVGAKNKKVPDKYLRDDCGDEISERNQSYCELTGMYWIWKNSREDIVGVCHYRRYFTKERNLLPKLFLLSEKQIYRIMQEYDVILPQRNHHEYSDSTALDFYARIHDVEDWNIVKGIIKDHYPEYYEDLLWFENEKIGYCYNMIISKKNTYDDYCEWLFDILFQAENVIKMRNHDKYNQRVYGFLSERLINIWIRHNHLLVKEVPVFQTDVKLITRVENKICNLIKKF